VTTTQIIWFTCLAAALTVVTAVVTRATGRRLLGAVAGAAVCGPIGLAILALCEKAGWWHMPMPWNAQYLTLFCIGIAVCGYPFLITWRIARRFGGRGLIVTLCIIAIIGPIRDSWYLKTFPQWGYYAPGVAPMLAISGAYVTLGIIGYATMRLIAGRAGADRLIRRPWEHT
jgi:hypothetical protein